MPDTFQAAVVIAIALVPGALYFWAFERQAGRWGVALSDRVLRFVGLSALFHAAVAPISYWFWADEWPKLRVGAPVSLWLWVLGIAYVALPLAGGTIIGFATRRELPWARWFAGPHPAPRAWDYLFEHEFDGWVRMRMKSGVWIGGVFAEIDDLMPYTAGYPEPQDLFLPATVDVDPETGEFPRDDDGKIVHRSGGLLVRWEEVEYLEFVEDWRPHHGKLRRRSAPSLPPEGVRRRLHVFRQERVRADPAAGPGSRSGREASRAPGDERQEVAPGRRAAPSPAVGVRAPGRTPGG